MKYLQLFTLLIIISSCSSTKRITETPPEKTAEIVTIKDSIVEKTKPAKTIETSIESKETVKDSIIKKNGQINDFNKTVTKHTIELHQLWDELLNKHVSDDGIVNYKSFKTQHKKLLDYIYVLSLLYQDDHFKSISREEKLAFWINAYNAMTVDLILRHYPLKSIKDIKKPWDQRFWKLGDKWYNLNEIEHDILRKMNEPRIHFGIVCASFSCPKLLNEAFEADTIDSQLTKATKAFLSDNNRNEISQNNIKLSKIFQWFAKDFKEEGSLIDFLNKYSEITISAKANKSFKDYNWDLNE